MYSTVSLSASLLLGLSVLRRSARSHRVDQERGRQLRGSLPHLGQVDGGMPLGVVSSIAERTSDRLRSAARTADPGAAHH